MEPIKPDGKCKLCAAVIASFASETPEYVCAVCTKNFNWQKQAVVELINKYNNAVEEHQNLLKTHQGLSNASEQRHKHAQWVITRLRAEVTELKTAAAARQPADASQGDSGDKTSTDDQDAPNKETEKTQSAGEGSTGGQAGKEARAEETQPNSNGASRAGTQEAQVGIADKIKDAANALLSACEQVKKAKEVQAAAFAHHRSCVAYLEAMVGTPKEGSPSVSAVSAQPQPEKET